jgi:tRNA(adenine34) deaminase
MENDIHYMQEALYEARIAFDKGEVPIGAVLVHGQTIIARAHNGVEALRDATAHAEMLVLRQGANILGNWRLLETTLYCTLEPCPMCAGAMIHSRVSRLVWGAPDLRCGAHGSWVNLLDIEHPIHCIETARGVLQEECADLMRTFFKQRRSHGEAVR